MQTKKLKTRLTLLIHTKEIRRMTNTGRLALLCLENSNLIMKGSPNEKYNPQDMIPEEYTSLILFPSASEELSVELLKTLDKPVNLIVPDGTWRQARKLLSSESKLHTVRRVKLPAGEPSSYILRKTDNKQNISTIEAIARALGILENKVIQKELECVLSELTGRLLKRNARNPQDLITYNSLMEC